MSSQGAIYTISRSYCSNHNWKEAKQLTSVRTLHTSTSAIRKKTSYLFNFNPAYFASNTSLGIRYVHLLRLYQYAVIWDDFTDDTFVGHLP